MKENHIFILGASLVAILVAFFLSSLIFGGEKPPQADQLVGDTPSPELLDQHTEEFRKDIIEVYQSYMIFSLTVTRGNRPFER